MSYQMNLKDEKPPVKKQLLPEGSREAEIVDVTEETSKSGNNMFVFQIKDVLTGHIDKFFCVTTEGKRWNLKMVLSACGIQPDVDGNYVWDKPDVIGKKVVCDIVHEPNDYINRNGEEVKGLQHKIAEITSFAWGE